MTNNKTGAQAKISGSGTGWSCTQIRVTKEDTSRLKRYIEIMHESGVMELL